MWRPGRDLNPGPAGDSRLYYSGIAKNCFVTGLYYQGSELGFGAVVTREIFSLIKLS
jgi:hypothetical protein